MTKATPRSRAGGRRAAPALAGLLATLAVTLFTPSASAAPPRTHLDAGKTQCRTTATGQSQCLLRRTRSVAPGAVNTLITSTVLPNVKDDLAAWVVYNPNDCSLVSSGAWTVTTPPTQGATSTGILNDVLSNGDCPGVVFPYALISYTWTGTDEAVKQDVFDAQWAAPGFLEPDHFVMDLATIRVSAVDLAAGTANLTIKGPSGITGTVTLEFSGSSTQRQPDTAALGTGSSTQRIDRPRIPRGSYDTLTATWNVSTPPIKGKLTPARAWEVLGTIRYSQYNTPRESACGGGTTAVWVVDNMTACTFTQVNLNASFASQVNVNGTGVSTNHGIVKAGAATNLRRACRGHFPAGATLGNSYLQVASVIGSCNTTLVANNSVASHGTLGLACNSPLTLVQTSNANFGGRTRADTCPACDGGFNGTDGHIDSYTDNEACTAHDVGDLGNYWTVKAR